MHEKKLIAGNGGFISLRDVFLELYKKRGYRDPDGTDLRVLFSSRSKYAKCEYVIEKDITKMGSLSINRESTVKWLCDGEPVDNKTDKWLTEVFQLLEWILLEGFPFYIRRVEDQKVDRIIQHPHADKETFVRTNLQSAFEDLSYKEPPIRSVMKLKDKQGEIFKYKGMYIQQKVFNGLVERFSGSPKKKGAPKKQRNKIIESAAIAHGRPEDFSDNGRFLLFLERHGIDIWGIEGGEKIPYREGYSGKIFLGDEIKPLAWETVTNMRLRTTKLVGTHHNK